MGVIALCYTICRRWWEGINAKARRRGAHSFPASGNGFPGLGLDVENAAAPGAQAAFRASDQANPPDFRPVIIGAALWTIIIPRIRSLVHIIRRIGFHIFPFQFLGRRCGNGDATGRMRQVKLEFTNPKLIPGAVLGPRRAPQIRSRGDGLGRWNTKQLFFAEHELAVIWFHGGMSQDQIVVAAAADADHGLLVFEFDGAQGGRVINQLKHAGLVEVGAFRAIAGPPRRRRGHTS